MGGDGVNEQEFRELSAGYALGALSDDDRRAVEDALAAHPEWVAHLRADVDAAALLADTATPVVPPPHLRADLLARIATTPQSGPDAGAPAERPAAGIPADASSVAPASPRRARRGWFVLAASLALVAALGIGTSVIVAQTARPAAVIALEQIQDSPDAQSARFDDGEIAATAYWSAETGQAVLVSDGLPQLADDKTFELWFVRDGVPLPAGTFDATGGTATALLAEPMEAGDVIAVTVEPDGGSPTGTPSTAPILTIES